MDLWKLSVRASPSSPLGGKKNCCSEPKLMELCRNSVLEHPGEAVLGRTLARSDLIIQERLEKVLSSPSSDRRRRARFSVRAVPFSMRMASIVSKALRREVIGSREMEEAAGRRWIRLRHLGGR